MLLQKTYSHGPKQARQLQVAAEGQMRLESPQDRHQHSMLMTRLLGPVINFVNRPWKVDNPTKTLIPRANVIVQRCTLLVFASVRTPFAILILELMILLQVSVLTPHLPSPCFLFQL